MKTDKDGNDMRGVTVNRFAEGHNNISMGSVPERSVNGKWTETQSKTEWTKNISFSKAGSM
ncbi:hypothetical protein DPX16_10138 [Anabarilius grahami]|uniref:Uncharacterized protein n=1 Tax=Anabarilius grahami TaxID=495550 RepID=A0A3N0XX13_ANAGA|nr:hypothetical protein DPX16_10138 [Anabarilius grahami]